MACILSRLPPSKHQSLLVVVLLMLRLRPPSVLSATTCSTALVLVLANPTWLSTPYSARQRLWPQQERKRLPLSSWKALPDTITDGGPAIFPGKREQTVPFKYRWGPACFLLPRTPSFAYMCTWCWENSISLSYKAEMMLCRSPSPLPCRP